MTDQDRPQFARLLHAMAAMYERQLEETVVEWYFEGLRAWRFEDVAQASKAWTEREKWFPKLAELRAQLQGGSGDDFAEAGAIALERALVTVGYMRSLLVEDPDWHGALLDTFGGWTEACDDYAALEPPMWEVRRKHFITAYRLRSQRPPGPDWQLLRGKADRDNPATAGTWRWTPERRAAWLQSGQEIGLLFEDGVCELRRVPYRDVGEPDLVPLRRQLTGGAPPALTGGVA